jgi:hypothetical protein
MATPAGWMLGCGCLLSCSAIFGIEASERRDESEVAGAGGSDAGRGGRSTGGRATGGTTGGSETGGRAGQGGEAGGGAVGNQSGTAGDAPGGAGGEGGTEDRGAILGEPCTGDETLTNTACTIGSPHLVLECDDKEGVWVVKDTCEGSQACIPERDGNDAACKSISAPCWGSYTEYDTNVYTNFCDGGNRLIDCESFRPEPYTRYCPFGCQDGACLSGTGDQLIVHTGSVTERRSRPRTLPVCVLDPIDGDENLVAWIRDEVERTWGRTNDYNFERWTECEQPLPAAGVVLSFKSGCRGHLVNDIDPQSELVRLEICRSFYFGDDELDDEQEVDDLLARFLGRHHFGHVIGAFDTTFLDEAPSTMDGGIELFRVTEYVLSPAELNLGNVACAPFCRKHPGALVTYRGRCLEVEDGRIVARTCADHGQSDPQDFTLRTDFTLSATELFTANPEQCVGVSGALEEAEVRVGECMEMTERFALTGAALRSLGRCVTPAALPATDGTTLWIGACDGLPESWTGWSFDVTASTGNALLASIRHDGLCVSVPGGVAWSNLVPELRPCEEGSDEQIFELKDNGEIGFGELCFAWGLLDGSVYLSGCGEGYSVWTVTTALTTPSGLALTLAEEDDHATAKPLGDVASETQTFDFYF